MAPCAPRHERGLRRQRLGGHGRHLTGTVTFAISTVDSTMSRLRPLLVSVAALAALPATAHAAPHGRPPSRSSHRPRRSRCAQSTGRPQALAGSAGQALGFAADGEGYAVAQRHDRGRTDRHRITSLSKGGARGATGADGTVAAVWSSGGTGHLATGQAGGPLGAPADLPGAGVDALDVAVSPDGTTTVAWRTKAADGTYQLLIAQAPRGGALGEAQVIDSGKAGISLVDAAAGANGTVAVAYTKSAPAYRTRVTVKPAGAAAFEPYQPVSSSTRADTSPAVAVGADGTVVAGWANPESGMVAFRRPGEAAFGAPVSLGAATYAVDLQPTPQGGLRSRSPSPARSAPRSRARRGLLPRDGRPRARPGPAHPLDRRRRRRRGGRRLRRLRERRGARGRPRRRHDPDRLRQARHAHARVDRRARRGSGVRPVDRRRRRRLGRHVRRRGSGCQRPRQKPAALDRTAPKLRLRSSRRISVTRRTTALKLKFACDEACAIGIESNLRTTLKGKRRIAPIPTLDTRRARSRPAGAQTVTLKLGRSAITDLRRALKAGKGAQVFLTATAADTAGNSSRLKVTVSLRVAKTRRERSRAGLRREAGPVLLHPIEELATQGTRARGRSCASWSRTCGRCACPAAPCPRWSPRGCAARTCPWAGHAGRSER